MSFFDKIGKYTAGATFAEQVASGFFAGDNFKDFSHASKLIRSDAFAYAPQYKFLFHVYFSLTDPSASPSDDKGLIGALVKSIDLPSYEIETDEHIQYNRKRLIHKRISYKPVEIKFHDDSSDIIRSLWYNYYNYYFSDAKYPYNTNTGDGYTGRDTYNIIRKQNNWGVNTDSLDGARKDPFFKNIKIFGMSRGNYVLYTLINPVITDWRHDRYDYTQGNGVMEHSVTFKYEAVKYARGRVGESVDGFGDPSRYDTEPSPLSKPGSTISIFGQAGLIDTGVSIAEDLASGNFIRAIQTAGRTAITYSKSPLTFSQLLKTDVKTEAVLQTKTVITQLGKGNSNAHGPGISFPKSGDNNKGNSNTVATPTKWTE